MQTTIRFFIITDTDEVVEQVEVTEVEFIEAEGEIEYERHTMFENDVDQICLTKNYYKA